jgi:uncharacterized membrane protein
MKMNFITRNFVRGLLVLLPLVLTIWPLYYFFSSMDLIVKRFVWPVLPDIWQVPGAGVILGLVTIFLLGVLMSAPLMQRLHEMIEAPLENIPMVRALYGAVKELTRYLTPSDEQKADRVVVVRFPGFPADVVGFLIRDDLSDLPEGLREAGRSAVYIPMSYQIGGFTVFLPNEWLTPVEMSVDDAMKHVLTGWMVPANAQPADEAAAPARVEAQV